MPHTVYRFGAFQLDPIAHELLKSGSRVALPPKSFDCVVYLIAHRERTVGRDELISAVWGRADVADTVLSQTLLRARRAIGDTGEAQEAIRTVPRFGYRWVAALDEVDAQNSPLPDEASLVLSGGDEGSTAQSAAVMDEAPLEALAASTTMSGPPGLVHGSRVRTVASLFFVLGLVAVVGWTVFPGKKNSHPVASNSATPNDSHLFVVLPVAMQGTHADTAWIRLGAMDYIASRMREEGALRVLPSDEVVSLVGKSEAADPRGTDGFHRIELSTGASFIIAPRAEESVDGWQFALDVFHEGQVLHFEGRAVAPMAAAARAASLLLKSLGVASRAGTSEPSAQTELVNRVDAAVLGGDLVEARTLLDTAPDIQRQTPELRVLAGRIAFRAGQLDEARSTFLPLIEDDSNAESAIRISAFLGLGAIANWQHRFADAQRYYVQAIATLGEQGEPNQRGRAHTGLGVAYMSTDRIADALAEFGRARVDLQRAGDPVGLADLDVDLGLAEGYRAHYADAIVAFDRALATYTRFGIRDKQAIGLLNKVDAQLSTLDIAGAQLDSERAWTLAEHLENRVLVEHVAIQRTRVLLASGQLKSAGEMINRLDPHGDPTRTDADPLFAVLRLNLLGQKGDFAQMTRHADAILDRVEHPSDPTRYTDFSECALDLIDAALRTGDLRLADHLVARLKDVSGQSPDRSSAYAVALADAMRLGAERKPAAAEQFAVAFGLADQRSANALIDVGVRYAEYLISAQQLNEASAIVGRLSSYVDKDYRVALVASTLYERLGERDLAGAAKAHVLALAGERDPRIAF